MTAHLVHLAGRLRQSVRTRALTPAEQAEVARLLRPPERALFWRQAPADQRHALACARFVARAAPGRADLARAALLHDVGKGLARMGVAGRVAATALQLLHLPTPGRLGPYLAHAERGAQELAAAGADALTVAYARGHHGPRPPGIAAADWDLLAAADRGAKAGKPGRRAIRWAPR